MEFARLPRPASSPADAFGKPKPDTKPPASAGPVPAPKLAPGAPADPAQLLQLFGGHLPEGAQAPAGPTPEQQAEIDKKVHESVIQARGTALALQLTVLSRNMSDATSRAFINTLDQIDDPELRHKVMEQFEAQTGQSLHDFIANCHDWNNNGEGRDKDAALQLIDEKRDQAEAAIAKMSPEEKARKEQAADEAAVQILSATTAHDHSDENMQKIFRALGGRDPAEIELVRAAIRRHTHGESNLYQSLDDGTHKGDEDEAIAMLAGDRVGSARAALANEDDPVRLREVVSGLKPEELARLKYDPMVIMLLGRIKNPSDRAEIGALIQGNKAEANAEHLGNLLKPKGEGFEDPTDKVGQENYDRRKPANVLKEFEAMSGEEVKAAAQAWNRAHPDRTFEQMLEARWGDDDDKTEYNRLLAMIHGDKGLDRSLRLQEGLRENDQEEIEGALAHEKTNEEALQSKDPEVRRKAEAVRAENESFEKNNVEADRRARQFMQDWTGGGDDAAPAVGRSTKEQLGSHYDAEARKDIGGSTEERFLGGQAADAIHADRQKKHDEEVRDNRVGAMELLDDGKLSAETEVHRGKGDKGKAEALENIKTGKELDEAKRRYREKYGTEMLPYTGKDRSDMNANELMIDNIRLYGPKAERPAQVEYLLQLQQYELQHSDSLEMSEAGDAGGGTQRWQRQELAAERDMLKDPKLQAGDYKLDTAHGIPILLGDSNEPTFDQIDKLLPMQNEKVDDGLKDGVTKQEFNRQDAGLTAANKAQEGAKKRLAERIVKIFSTIAKIAAALTAQPELIALIDIGEGLLEMGIKREVMGEAYDPAEDAKMLAFTAVADVALMGLSKVGKMKGAASLAEKEAVGAEKTAMEMEHAVSGEAKAEALKDGAHAAAGESQALEGAIEEGTSAEKALTSEGASAVGQKVESKAAEVAEGKALEEGESAAAKTAAADVEKEVTSPEELAKKIEARWGQYGGAAKMAIQTIGGGIVQGKSPSEILKGLVTGSIGLVLPGHLAEKVQKAIGNDSMALKILGEIASFGTEVAANTTISVAGGAEGGDAFVDSLIGAGGGRAQRLAGGGHGGVGRAEEAPAAEKPAVVPEKVAEPLPLSAPKENLAPMPARAPEERTPVQERIEATTSGGASYQDEMARLREFYAQQEIEAQDVSNVKYTDVDQFRDERTGKPLTDENGAPIGYKGYTNYDVREFSHGVTAIEVRLHLAGGATPEEMARVRAETIKNIDGVVNHQENMLTNRAGDESRLHVEVVFVDDPAQAHATVNVHSGEGRSDQLNWYADEPGIQYAHEMMHHLGLGDEYVDPRTVRRKDELAPDVHLDEEHPSIVGGDYLVHDLDNPGKAMAHPDTELKQRHMDALSEKINERRAADGAAKGPTVPDEAAPLKQSAPDDPETAFAKADEAYERLSEEEKRDPSNPVVRARNDALTRANALRDPEAPVVDAQAEFEASVEAEKQRVLAERAAKESEPKAMPEAAEAKRAEAEAQRKKDAENAAQRDQIEADKIQLERLGHEIDDGGDRARIEGEMAKLRQRIAENEAAVAARAQAVADEQQAQKESLAARQKESADKANAVKERSAGAAEAERTAEESARADAAREEAKTKEDREAAETAKLEKDRLDAMSPEERAIHDGLAEAKARQAELEAQWDQLSEADKQDTSNPVVEELLRVQDRVQGLENPGARTDARGELEASQAALRAEQKAEADRRASELKPLPDAEARNLEAGERAQAQREEDARNAAQRDQIEEDERRLVTLRNERADGGDVAKIDEQIREAEKRLEDNKAAVQKRAEEAARAYEAEAEERRAREAASQEAMRQAKEKEAARAKEDEARRAEEASKRLAEETAAKEAKKADAARKQEADVLAAMSPGERATHDTLAAAKERLAELDRELDALPDDKKASWPKMRERNDVLEQVHGLENPGAPRLDAANQFETDVAAQTQKQEQAERVRRESQVREDPEAKARAVQADEQSAAQTAAAREAAARREDIAKDETEIAALRDEEFRVGQKLEAAERDGDSFAAEDHQAKLEELAAKRAEIEARVARAKAEEQARTDAEVKRQQDERAAEKARQAADDEKLAAQAADLEARREQQAAEDKAKAEAESNARYAEEAEKRRAAEEKKRAELRASLAPDLVPLFDALTEKELAQLALQAEVGDNPALTDPRVARLIELAEDIESLEKTVFPNGRPR